MPRRFLTVEDLREARGGELVVDAGTVVTPQALEAARAAGITIRSTDGPYVEPSPDRGPDAALATRSLPNLPEPEGTGAEGVGLVVTVVGRNRPGVLAEVTATIASHQGNIHDVSQKMIEGYFHMVLTVTFPPGVSFQDVEQALACLGGPDDYVARAMHERVFRFMHRV